MKIDGMEANNSAAANDGTAAGASSTHASTEDQEIDASAGYDYEVFLSFRGPDTRATFTDFLWTTLDRWGIRTFKDDGSLRVGEEFEQKLLQAINKSKISIPILSKGYASSPWCLKELVQMVKCQKKGTQQIKPIFYDVSPSEVRHQTGDYEKAFKAHEQKGRYDAKTMQDWRDALSAVAAISGWDLHSEGENRREGGFAERVTQQIFNDLEKPYLVVPDCFVDVNDEMMKIKDIIAVETSETRIIGIHGMGGIGKTTIAKKIYNELSNKFHHCCFLSDIRETSKLKCIVHLQRQLVCTVLRPGSLDIKNKDDGIMRIQERLRDKKVLLLLDDVDHKEHMEALVGKRNWFGKGSRLIITTRNKEVLEVTEVDNIHEVNGMDRDQSLQLFCKHAFRRDFPLDADIAQSDRAINIAAGLPLALEIIGSLLGSIEKEQWDDKLKDLESVPHDKVQSKLKISYDALNDRQKRIFLYIACLFIGYDRDFLIRFWDAHSLLPKEAMQILQNLSLIKICKNNIWMHDQLRDLGREMIRKESKMKIEKQRIVWNPKEGLRLLKKPEVKKKVEALRFRLDNQQRYRITYEFFENLADLRFLEVDGPMQNLRAEDRLLWHEQASDVLATDQNSNLLPELLWLSWQNIPPTFNITNFSMEEVVILNLSYSKITDDWSGWNYMEVMKNLKSLDLSYFQDFRRLPNKLGSNHSSLEYLFLGMCTSLEMLPDTLGNLKSLIELDVSYTSIGELPDSIRKLKNLKKVYACGSSMRKISDAFWTFEKLEEIEFGTNWISCKELHVKIGDGIYRNQSLRVFSLIYASIHALPPRLPESLIKLELIGLRMVMIPDLSNLNNLKELDMVFGSYKDDGKSYGFVKDPMPRWFGNLSKLESLHLKFYYETAPPTDISLPPRLKSLHLERLNLRFLPKLPSSLSSLQLESCSSLCSMEDVSNLKNLSFFYICDAAMTEIQGLGYLENLRDLYLFMLKQLQILPDLSNLNILRLLKVTGCDNLVEIQGELPRSLDSLMICQCPSLRNLPDLSSLVGKQWVDISHCGKLNVEVILGFALKNNSRDLKIVGFDEVHILPDLSKSNELRRLEVSSCHNLVEIQGELPQSLVELTISSCKSLEKLPVLSNLKKLRSIEIRGCGKLNGEAILGFAQKNPLGLQLQILPDLSNSDESRRLRVDNGSNLVEVQADVPWFHKKLGISDCEGLYKLPNLSSLMWLRVVHISSCANLVEIQQGDLPESLELLTISSCESLMKLPDLSSLMGLQILWILSCAKLVEIHGELPQSVTHLQIFSCESLLKLPNLSCLKKLQGVTIKDCPKLEGEAILGSSSKKV